MSLTKEIIVDGVVEPGERKSIVKPYMMSHGTLECYSLKDSRKFYEFQKTMEIVDEIIDEYRDTLAALAK